MLAGVLSCLSLLFIAPGGLRLFLVIVDAYVTGCLVEDALERKRPCGNDCERAGGQDRESERPLKRPALDPGGRPL